MDSRLRQEMLVAKNKKFKNRESTSKKTHGERGLQRNKEKLTRYLATLHSSLLTKSSALEDDDDDDGEEDLFRSE